MEKIRLSNDQEFNIIPMGISQTEKRRYFKFISNLTYAEVFAMFSAIINLSSIAYLLEDGTTSVTYTDCVALKSLSFAQNVAIDENTTADVFMAEISIDAVEMALQSILAKANMIGATVDYILCEAIPTLVG